MILKKKLNRNINFFGDDIMPFSRVKDPDISANDLNHDHVTSGAINGN